ncbi:multidrug efflux RND transporter permease subunit [Burkholderia sp. WAC0059]|uniref:multidrug efflux RND transporter permease subunit n=1 Tax=Burkholderia sp. WAC0059 TaxID=2066022 RepID=UPI000C7E8C4D|nr:multidrug efflux RND transporter permease subunit [Burkholderia sp. WAC0059]PLZ00883.1 multidrug efflux RND transporter permease subunit [Burkholderia sp. WAC0059]
MPSFFIDRPVFAWIVALAVVVVGLLALPQLPVAQYPLLAPPRIVITTTWPGAAAEVTDEDVASIIEQSLDGADGLMYYETSSDALGDLEIDVTFQPGTNPDIALVDVQNRLKQIEARLPQQVVQQGIDVVKAANTFLMLVSLTSTDGSRDSAELSDYLSRYVVRELKRAPGVGSVEQWDANEAMRIWLDPIKLREYGLSAEDVTNAVSAQNAPVTAGTMGDAPYVPGQQIDAPVTVRGQLLSPAEFGQIVLKAEPSGAAVRLADVARIEIGRDNYTYWSRLNGRPAATLGIQLGPRGNALETSEAIRARLAELAKTLPPGVAIQIPFDTAQYVRVAIREVAITLAEAVALVFLVMWLFLRELRYALVPAVVIPVTLTGTLAILWALGLSINVFTLFGLVLAIGMLVDDAIVVVESVHRAMDEGLAPRAATRRAMGRIGGAIVGVSAVLTAVFVPMAFFPGTVGGIYRQFAAAMISAMLVSSFMALSLAPALCANHLKAPGARSGTALHLPGGLRGLGAKFGDRFAAALARLASGYRRLNVRTARRPGPAFVVYAVLLALGGLLYWKLPGGFLPTEDEGQLQVMIQLPAGATLARTEAVVERTEQILRAQPGVANMTSVLGWSFAGSGQNVGMVFVTLTDWSRRIGAAALRDRLNRQFDRILDAQVMTMLPPSVPGVGHAEGFTLRLEDRGGVGVEVLKAARQQLENAASKDPMLAQVYAEDLPDAPRLVLDVDRAKAYALGVPFDRLANLLGNTFGSNYVDDFPAGGQMYRVLIAADAPTRMTSEDLMDMAVENATGQMVPLSAFVTPHWGMGPVMLTRYNGYPSLDLEARAADGYSSGAAMAELARLAAANLPLGIAYDWVDAAREQTEAARVTPLLVGLSVLAVFMALAALYESWTVPFVVLTVLPLGVFGALAAATLRGLPNDVYFKVGMITVIGLAAKNAILIVQFAHDLRRRGAPLRRAVCEAAAARLRPVLMTSAAFVLGVLPLVFADGAGAQSRRSIGTGVFGGMLAATVLGLVFVPVAYRAIARLGSSAPRTAGDDGADPADEPPVDSGAIGEIGASNRRQQGNAV